VVAIPEALQVVNLLEGTLLARRQVLVTLLQEHHLVVVRHLLLEAVEVVVGLAQVDRHLEVTVVEVHHREVRGHPPLLEARALHRGVQDLPRHRVSLLQVDQVVRVQDLVDNLIKTYV